MPIGVNVDNPQEQLSSTPVNLGTSITFGGNVLGGGSSSTGGGSTGTSSFSFSTILMYGAIALVIIFILKKLQKN